MPIVQFAPFQSLVEPAFWHALTDLKIDVLRLSDDAVPLTATYTTGRSITDRETGKDIALASTLSVGGDAFSKTPQSVFPIIRCSLILTPSLSFDRVPQSAIAATGSFKNFNTIEDFKNADKSALFNALADEIWTSITVDKSTALLNRFLLITFADLKKYKYFYWFAFPAFAAKPAWEIDGDWTAAESTLGADAVCSPSLQ